MRMSNEHEQVTKKKEKKNENQIKDKSNAKIRENNFFLFKNLCISH